MMRMDDARSEGVVRMRDLFAMLMRRRRLIAAIALPVIAFVALYSYSRTNVYEASTGLLVRPPLTALTNVTRPSDISAQTETNLATSVAVAQVAKQLMNSPLTPQELLKHASAEMTQDTQVLKVSFTDTNPVAAQRGAAAFGDAYLKYRQQRAEDLITQQADVVLGQLGELRKEVATLTSQVQSLPPGSSDRVLKQGRLTVLQSRIVALQGQLVSIQSVTANPGEVIDPASVPSTPVSPKHSFDIAVGILLGLALGVGVALAKERNSEAVRGPGELQEGLGVPVLASIPKTPRSSRERAALIVARGQRTVAADQYRRLRTALLRIVEPAGMKTVLVTSAESGEGKTTTVVNLGLALAEIGKDVVLVSADLRDPAFQRIFPGNEGIGLSQILSDGVSPSQVLQEALPNLRVVQSGALPNHLEPVNLLQTDRMQRFLAACAADADFVLLDSPPVLGVPDTLVLARQADAVLFVADAQASRWDDIHLARDQIDRAGGVIVAGLLNRVEVARRDRRAHPSHRLGQSDRALLPKTSTQRSSRGGEQPREPSSRPGPGETPNGKAAPVATNNHPRADRESEAVGDGAPSEPEGERLPQAAESRSKDQQSKG